MWQTAAIMDAKQAIQRLQELGTAQNRKVYARHDASAETFGVLWADMRKVSKAIGRDQEVADALWATAAFEPQVVACMVAEPLSFKRTDVERWARESSSRAVADEFAKDIVMKTGWAEPLAKKWIVMKGEIQQRTGWTTYGLLAAKGETPDSVFLDLLPVIERDIHSSANWTTEAMNYTLIAIGGRSPVLRKAAIASAKRIGYVHVDQGETYCKTREAIPYIEKIWARKEAGTAR